MQSFTASARPLMHPTTVYTVCPRRKPAGLIAPASASGQVAITFQLLKPYFNRPLTETAEELGLSATAIKKACRTFGIPKWPFRTLASKTSRNRTAFQQIAMRLNNQEPILPTLPAGEEQQAAAARRPSGYMEAPPVMKEEEVGFCHSITSFSFDQCSANSSHCEGSGEGSEDAAEWEQAVSSPLETVENAVEEKQMADNWLFDKLQATDSDCLNKFLCGSETFEEFEAPMPCFGSMSR